MTVWRRRREVGARVRVDAESVRMMLDVGPLTADEAWHLACLFQTIMSTQHDVLVLPAEAALTLEAVADAVGGPGVRVLNVVSGPYGRGFGAWLRRSRADVDDFEVPFDHVPDAGAVRQRIVDTRPDVVSVVHVEAATGGRTPLHVILDACQDAGAVSVVDAVASIGADSLPVDAWGADIVVVGAQKALAGPAGVSAVAVSPAAWRLVEQNPSASRDSFLSLMDWKDAWADVTRGHVSESLPWLEARAASFALERVLREGLDAVVERHRVAAARARDGVRRLGLELWQRDGEFASVATTFRIPEGAAGAPLRAGRIGGVVTDGFGELRGHLLRIDHFGRAATAGAVDDALARVADVLRR